MSFSHHFIYVFVKAHIGINLVGAVMRRQVSHEEMNRTADVGARRLRTDDDAVQAASRCRSRRLMSAESAAWLASLQIIATEYRRAEAAARAEAARETVRLQIHDYCLI